MQTPALDVLLATLAHRYPGIAIDRDAVAAALAERELPADDANAIDVALAVALAAGDPVAVTAFDREIAPLMRAALGKLGRDADFTAEVVQHTHVRLLVPEAAGAAPRILGYRGRGKLSAWVQVIAMREALMSMRATKREVSADEELVRLTFTEPVLARSREVHKRELAAALRRGMEDLEARERNLLRLCFIEGVSGDQLGRMFDVHRTTAFRWLREAREHLLERTRAHFLAAIGVADAEVDSLMRSLAGSLSAIWGEPPA